MKLRGFGIVFVMTALMLGGSALTAQEITIDWADKTIKSSPTEIHKGDVVKVTVINVNDILYDYKINVSLQTQGSSDDLASLAKLIGGSINLKSSPDQVKNPCDQPLESAKAILATIKDGLTNKANNLKASASSQPIPLAASLAGWETVTKTDGNLAKLDNAVAEVKRLCTGDQSQEFLAGAYDTFDKIRKKVEGSHTATGQSVASSGDVSAVIIDVSESYKDTSGNTQTVYIFSKTLTFASVLNLSGGVLFSTLRHPSYVRQTVPGATDPILGIGGGSQPVPYIVGLLNYRFPGLDWATVGVALSTGPVLRVGGDSGTASFGYFNGVSLHFWHRLFVTAGSHVGQFPDIPAGFKIGQTVPSSFGQLAPANRWSARFAIAVTYKTNNLGALAAPSTKDKSTQPNNSNPSAAPKKNTGGDAATASSGATTTNPSARQKKQRKKILGIF